MMYSMVLVFILGLSIGSFLNVVICRWPTMLVQAMRRDASQLLNQSISTGSVFNLAYPASHCQACKNSLRWWQNIPLLSYLLLKGQCYFCKISISPRYFLVELLMGVLALFLFLKFSWSFIFFASFFFCCLMVLIICIDWEHQFLPDLLSYLLLWAGLIVNIYGYFSPLREAVLGAVVGYLVFWLIYWGFKILAHKEGLGYGDFKLLAALGAWLGVFKLPYLVLLASLLTLLGFAARAAVSKTALNQPMAYGPGLVLAGFVLLFFQWSSPVSAGFFKFF